MQNLLSLPNAVKIVNGQGRVNEYTRSNNPVEFDYRPHVDVKEWFVKTSFEYDRGEVCGIITEPGPLTLALQHGESILIHDLDRCQDSEVFDLIEEEMLDAKKYKAVVLAVAHDEFKELDMEGIGKNGTVIYDVKSFLPKEVVSMRL